MAAAEDLCRGLVCSMLLFCVVASLWCIVNTIAVAIRDQAISLAVESFQAQPKAKATPKAKVAAQPPVPPPGDNNRRKSKGKKEEASLLSLLSSSSWSFLSCLPTWPWAARTSFCDNAAFASKLPIGRRAFVSMSDAE